MILVQTALRNDSHRDKPRKLASMHASEEIPTSGSWLRTMFCIPPASRASILKNHSLQLCSLEGHLGLKQVKISGKWICGIAQWYAKWIVIVQPECICSTWPMMFVFHFVHVGRDKVALQDFRCWSILSAAPSRGPWLTSGCRQVMSIHIMSFEENSFVKSRDWHQAILIPTKIGSKAPNLGWHGTFWIPVNKTLKAT